MMNQGLTQAQLGSEDFIMSQLATQESIPTHLSEMDSIKKLSCIGIMNFKSFGQKTYAGPFENFTSIIGPNGSGKSNILDALSFCLCAENFKNHYFDVRELIHRSSNETYKDMTKRKKKCSVEAEFHLNGLTQLRLRRDLHPDGTERYFINDEEHSKKLYEHFLVLKRLNPHIPNYCITQGEIDKLLLKSPEDLTKHLESISGSILLKKPYEETKQEGAKASKEIEAITEDLKKLKAERKTVRNINQAARAYEEAQNEYNLINQRLFLAKIFSKDLDMEEMKKIIERKKVEEKEQIEVINSRKQKIMSELKLKQDLNKQINTLEQELAQTVSQLKTMESKSDHLLKEGELSQMKIQLQHLHHLQEGFQNKRNSLASQIPTLPQESIIKEYLEIYSQWQSKNLEAKIYLDNQKAHYYHLETQLQFQRSLVEEDKEKERKHLQNTSRKKQELNTAKAEIKKIGTLIASIQKESEKFVADRERNIQLLNTTKIELQRLKNEEFQIEEILTEHVESASEKQMIKMLYKINGFKGAIEQKVRPNQQKFVLPFGVLVSPISKYLLCSNESTSSEISNRLKEFNLLKTLVILENVKKPTDDSYINSKLGGRGILAFQAIDFDKNLQGLGNFLKDFCKGKVICDNLSVAFDIRKSKIQGVKQIITLEGDVLKSDGAITSHGNSEHLKKTYKIGNNKRSLENELSQIVKNRQKTQQKVDLLEKESSQKILLQKNEEIRNLKEKKVELEEKIQVFEGMANTKYSPAFKQSPKNIEKIEAEIRKVESQIQQTEKGMEKDKKFEKFMKKYKIENLQNFRATSNLELLEKETRKKNEFLRQVSAIEVEIKEIGIKKENLVSKIESYEEQIQLHFDRKEKERLLKLEKDQMNRLKDLKTEVSKLAIISNNSSEYQNLSHVSQMEAKYRYLQSKNKELVEQLKQEMGIRSQIHMGAVDYTVLEEYMGSGVQRMSRRRIEEAIKDLSSELRDSEEKIAKLNAMNLFSKSDSKNPEELQGEIKHLQESLLQRIEQKNVLSEKQLALKLQRKKVFLDFFERLKSTVQEVYKILTKKQGSETVGRVNLYLENSQTPFDYGIYYTPTPPNKRFVYDLEQLSGGEKSMASLALAFALAIVSKSPFMIIDESDAYLDFQNSQSLLKMVLQYSSGHGRGSGLESEGNVQKTDALQIIMISHKKAIFGESESLVGVTRPMNTCSQVFSLKLRRELPEYQSQPQMVLM